MLLVALTGNYGMGKSTVVSLFRKLGVSTLDTDRIVESLLRGKKILKKIKQLLGEKVFNESGNLNKKKVADIIFKSASVRRSLEDILHPFVFDRIKDFIDKMNVKDKILIIAAPLVYERRYEDRFDRTIVVHTREEIAVRRLGEKGVPRKDVLLRLKAQLPIEEKKKRADFLIDNNGAIEETMMQVKMIYKKLLKEAENGDNQRTRGTKRKLS
jgi:dephospho-CoA kinase